MRPDEVYMYKYLKEMKVKKKKVIDDDVELDSDASDPELEAFAR